MLDAVRQDPGISLRVYGFGALGEKGVGEGGCGRVDRFHQGLSDRCWWFWARFWTDRWPCALAVARVFASVGRLGGECPAPAEVSWWSILLSSIDWRGLALAPTGLRIIEYRGVRIEREPEL